MLVNSGMGNIIGPDKKWDADNTMGGIGMVAGLLLADKHPVIGLPVALWGAIVFFRLL